MKWGQMNDDELESVIGSGFKRNYREAVSRRRAWEVLPREIQTRFPIANTGENLEANEPAKLAANGEWNGTPCPLEVKQLIETIRKKDAAVEK